MATNEKNDKDLTDKNESIKTASLPIPAPPQPPLQTVKQQQFQQYQYNQQILLPQQQQGGNIRYISSPLASNNNNIGEQQNNRVLYNNPAYSHSQVPLGQIQQMGRNLNQTHQVIMPNGYQNISHNGYQNQSIIYSTVPVQVQYQYDRDPNLPLQQVPLNSNILPIQSNTTPNNAGTQIIYQQVQYQQQYQQSNFYPHNQSKLYGHQQMQFQQPNYPSYPPQFIRQIPLNQPYPVIAPDNNLKKRPSIIKDKNGNVIAVSTLKSESKEFVPMSFKTNINIPSVEETKKKEVIKEENNTNVTTTTTTTTTNIDKILLDLPVQVVTTNVSGFIIEDSPSSPESYIPIKIPIVSKEDNNLNENVNAEIAKNVTKTQSSSYISSPEDSPRVDDNFESNVSINKTKSPVIPQISTSTLNMKKDSGFIIDDPISSSDDTPRDDKSLTQSKVSIIKTKSPVIPQISTSTLNMKKDSGFIIDDPISSGDNTLRDDKRTPKVPVSKIKSPKLTPTKKEIENNNIPTENLSTLNNSMKSLSISNDNIKISNPILKRKIIFTKERVMSFRPTFCPSKSGFNAYTNLCVSEDNGKTFKIPFQQYFNKQYGYWHRKDLYGKLSYKGSNNKESNFIQRGQTVPHNEKQVKERKKFLADDADSKFKHEVLGVLNKLTPERFDKLTLQLCDVKITSSSMLDILIKMIFHNAINEPKFSNLFANMCSCLDENNNKLWCTELYNKTSIIFDQSSGKYFWIRNLQIDDLSVVGPYNSMNDGINDITRNVNQLLTLTIENLIIYYILVIDNILIKVFRSTTEEKYFINYSPFNDISKEDRSTDFFQDKKSAEKDAYRVNSFSRRLVKFCQDEYDHAVNNTGSYSLKEVVERITDTTTDDEKTMMELEYEDNKMQLKKKKLNTIRFIGELFKNGMLKNRRLIECIIDLIGRKDQNGQFIDYLELPDESHLELLCQMLTTVGQEIEIKASENQKNQLFDYLLQYSKEKRINSRVRMAIEEVISLRERKWKSRREQEGPLTITEINKKIEIEEKKKEKEAKLNYISGPRGGGGINKVLYNSQPNSNFHNNNQSNSQQQRTQQKTSVPEYKVMPRPKHSSNSKDNNNDNNDEYTLLKRNTIVDSVDSVEKVVDEISDSKIENRVKTIISEYIEYDDIAEVILTLDELPTRSIAIFIISLMDRYLSSSNGNQQIKMLNMLRGIGEAGKLKNSRKDIELSLSTWEPLLTLWDFVLECKKAALYIGTLLKILINFDVCSKKFINNIIQSVRKECLEDEYGPSDEQFNSIYLELNKCIDR